MQCLLSLVHNTTKYRHAQHWNITTIPALPYGTNATDASSSEPGFLRRFIITRAHDNRQTLPLQVSEARGEQ